MCECNRENPGASNSKDSGPAHMVTQPPSSQSATRRPKTSWSLALRVNPCVGRSIRREFNLKNDFWSCVGVKRL